MLDEFDDVSMGEKAIMKLWNTFVLQYTRKYACSHGRTSLWTNALHCRHPMLSDSRIVALCESFIDTCAAELKCVSYVYPFLDLN